MTSASAREFYLVSVIKYFMNGFIQFINSHPGEKKEYFLEQNKIPYSFDCGRRRNILSLTFVLFYVRGFFPKKNVLKCICCQEKIGIESIVFFAILFGIKKTEFLTM